MLACSALPVWAQNVINLQPGFWNTLEALTIPALVSAFVKLILIVAALVFFFLLIIGGIQWMTSGGDKTATEAARGRITAALIGLVIVFAAWAIGSLINYFFNVNIFNLEIPRVSP
jgi:TRAP-type C4-dicarboxylate transport system permease small subunit